MSGRTFVQTQRRPMPTSRKKWTKPLLLNTILQWSIIVQLINRRTDSKINSMKQEESFGTGRTNSSIAFCNLDQHAGAIFYYVSKATSDPARSVMYRAACCEAHCDITHISQPFFISSGIRADLLKVIPKTS